MRNKGETFALLKGAGKASLSEGSVGAFYGVMRCMSVYSRVLVSLDSLALE